MGFDTAICSYFKFLFDPDHVLFLKASKIEAIDFRNKTKLHCRFACMGKMCKHENYKKCNNPAIIGLHSEWVVNLVIGS